MNTSGLIASLLPAWLSSCQSITVGCPCNAPPGSFWPLLSVRRDSALSDSAHSFVSTTAGRRSANCYCCPPDLLRRRVSPRSESGSRKNPALFNCFGLSMFAMAFVFHGLALREVRVCRFISREPFWRAYSAPLAMKSQDLKEFRLKVGSHLAPLRAFGKNDLPSKHILPPSLPALMRRPDFDGWGAR